MALVDRPSVHRRQARRNGAAQARAPNSTPTKPNGPDSHSSISTSTSKLPTGDQKASENGKAPALLDTSNTETDKRGYHKVSPSKPSSDSGKIVNTQTQTAESTPFRKTPISNATNRGRPGPRSHSRKKESCRDSPSDHLSTSDCQSPHSNLQSSHDRPITPPPQSFVVKLPLHKFASEKILDKSMDMPDHQVGTRLKSSPKDSPHLLPPKNNGDLNSGAADLHSPDESVIYASEGSSCSSPPTSLPSIIDDSKTNVAISLPLAPLYRPYCRDWMLGRCTLSFDCPDFHEDVNYNPPVTGMHPRPRQPCWKWRKGACQLEYACSYMHGDLKYDRYVKYNLKSDLDSASSLSTDESRTSARYSSSISMTKRTQLSHLPLPIQPQLSVEKRPSPPNTRYLCRGWLVNDCNLGSSCSFIHGNIDYDPPVQPIYPPPKFSSQCKAIECFLGYACEYTHKELDYNGRPFHIKYQRQEVLERSSHNDTQVVRRPKVIYESLSVTGDSQPHRPPPSKAEVSSNYDDPPVGMRPYPYRAETCRKWLQNNCRYRYRCNYRHGDLEYDPPLRPPGLSLPSSKAHGTVPQGSVAWTLPVQDHAKVKIGPGFEVQEVVTGFETPWVLLGKIPSEVNSDEITTLLERYGEVLNLKMPGSRANLSTMSVRVQFSTPEEAREACTNLNGTEAFGCTITASLPIHDNSGGKATFRDDTIRIRWQAPSKTAYCGYTTLERAHKAMEATRVPFRDHYVHAEIYVGLPVAGIVTVRFRGIPINTNAGDMEQFNHPDDVIWGQPNYQNLDEAVYRIRRILLANNTDLLEFNVLPPPYRNAATVLAYAHFNTASDAKIVRDRLNGRAPLFTGRTTIVVDHVQSLTFSLSPALFDTLGPDIYALSFAVKRFRRRTAMTVVPRLPLPTLVRLSGDNLKELGELKAEFEKIFNWEVVKLDSRVAWDAFFAHPPGFSFLENLGRYNPNVTIKNDPARRMIRLRGCVKFREGVRLRILDKIQELNAEKVWYVVLEGRLAALFMGSKDFMELRDKLGRDNVFLDLYNRRLRIRGNDAIYEAAQDAVQRVRQGQQGVEPHRNIVECPVCFDEVTKPVTLPCGHAWCRACFSRYLTTSVDNKYFPLTCLGDEGKCKAHVPLNIARKILTIPEFDALVEAAFVAYVQSRPDEFYYCPTPDCTQIYRSAPRDTVLQCPSCLLHVCPNCHVEAHDGFECLDPDGGNSLFKEWMKENDVKPCPGCKVPIERAEGCNHMMCTQCKTHICWVCMQTFPGGVGIYDHMRSAHGGIGLAVEP